MPSTKRPSGPGVYAATAAPPPPQLGGQQPAPRRAVRIVSPELMACTALAARAGLRGVSKLHPCANAALLVDKQPVKTRVQSLWRCDSVDHVKINLHRCPQSVFKQGVREGSSLRAPGERTRDSESSKQEFLTHTEQNIFIDH